jgi:glucokinase
VLCGWQVLLCAVQTKLFSSVAPLMFHPQQAMHSLGIEIGGTKLQIVVGDGAGRIVERFRFAIDKAKRAAGIRAQIETALPPLQAKWKPQRVGVGFGGPVDRKTGRIARSHQIEGWSEFDLAAWLRQLVSAPVCLDNDANVGALGEAVRGAGAGFNPVFYVTLGSGVGGGLVVDGKIYHGAAPGESEIGHVRLDKSGATVEERCSGWAVDAKIRELKREGIKSALCDWIGDSTGGEAKFLARALTEEDAAAWRILRETAEDLAFGLSHVVHLFHPQVIVLGGGLSLVGEPLRAAVAEALPRFVMKVFSGTTEVKLAALGEDAVPVGALLMARE